MVFRAVEGRILQLGTVSGTDETPIGLYEPTWAQRVFLENPIFIPAFDQTVINTTASGDGVVIQGGGIVTVNTAGQIITVSGPAFEDVEGDDVDSINTLTGTVTLDGLGNNTVFTNVGTNTISVSGSTAPAFDTITLPSFTPDSVLFVNSSNEIDEQPGDFEWMQSEGKNTLHIDSDGTNPVISGTRTGGGTSPFMRIDSAAFNPWFSGPAAIVAQRIFQFDPNVLTLMNFNTASTLTSTVDFVQDGLSGLRLVFNNFAPPQSAIITPLPGSQGINQLVIGATVAGQRLHLQGGVSVANTLAFSDPTPTWTLLDVRGDMSISGTGFSLYVPDGTVGKPSFSFNEDQDTGVYRNGSGEVCIVKDGAEELCVGVGFVDVPNSLTVSGVPVLTSSDPGVATLNTLDGDLTIQGQNTVTVSTSDPTITISGSGIASLGPGPDGLVYIDDPTRGGKRLSIDRQVVLYSTDGAVDGTYLRAGNVINSFAGWIIPRDGTITAATYGYISGAATKDFLIRINNATTLNTTNVPSTPATIDSGLDIDVDAGDVLQIFISATGAAINDAFATIEVAWRA